jgi:hypothetical protein
MSEVAENRRGRVRRGLRTLGWSALAVLAAGVFWRAAVASQKTAGGWQLIADHIVGVLPPWKSLGRHDQDVRVWRGEQAERVLNDPQAKAADYMAAAYAFSAYGPRLKHASPQQIGRVMWGEWPDSVAVPANSADNQTILPERLAAKATKLDPGNKSYCRLRAALLSEDIDASVQADEQWNNIAAVLQSASENDPDNALYDYLLGVGKYLRAQKWITRDGAEGQETVLIFDPQLFDESRKHYESGMAKSKVADGAEVSQTVAELLGEAPGSILCKLNCINDSDVEGRRWNLTARLNNPFYPDARANIELAAMAEQTHLWFLQQDFGKSLRAQYSGENPPAYWALSSGDRRLQAAVQLWMQDANLATRRTEASMAWSVFAVAASLSTWFLLAVAGMAMLAKVALRRRSAKPAGGVGLPIVGWIVAFATTFTVLMFLTSNRYRVAGREIFFWTCVALAVVALVAFFWFATLFILRQGKRPPARRSRLYHPARLALAIGGTFVMLVPLLCVADPKIRRAIAYGWDEIPNMSFFDLRCDNRLEIEGYTLADSILQWVLHFGIEWTLGAWIVLFASTSWFVKWWRRSERSESIPSTTWRDKLATGMSYVVRSTVPVMTLLFLLSVAAATQWVVCLQSQYDKQLARLGNPRWVAEGIDAVLKTLPAAVPDGGPLGESDDEPQSQ